MKRLRRVFELTVAEQRAVIVLLIAFLLFVAYRTQQNRTEPALPVTNSQPSPSPGILP